MPFKSPIYLDYSIVDVFADRVFQGNQLAVVKTDSNLTKELMYEITREFGFSETTFILRNNDLEKPVPVRIFGLNGEMRFAGHPSLGTAFVLRGKSGVGMISLSLPVGTIPVSFMDSQDGTICEMRQPDPEFQTIHDPVEIAKALGVSNEAIDTTLPVQTVSTGNRFVIVPFRHLSDLAKVKLDRRAWSYLAEKEALHFYLISQETMNKRARVHARMIYEMGEDPGTGSAAGPACAYMLKYNLMGSGESLMIEQGIEFGRPSLLRISGLLKGSYPSDIRVAGKCFESAVGKIGVPVSGD